MAIHHSTKIKAEKLGIMLTDLSTSHINLDGGTSYTTTPAFENARLPADAVQAYWGRYNVYAFGAGEKPAQAALSQMEAIMAIKAKDETRYITNKVDDPFMVLVFNNERTIVLDRDGCLPSDALILMNDPKHVWQSTTIPTDGGEAHKQGFPITDNPHDEEADADDFAAWDEQWEASADASDAEADEPDTSGSVVKSEYRARYAEAGHPAHCGDWLAETLNNLILGKTHTDLEKFEELCALNGVDTSKYKREGTGWQGRIRMTGRNLLARKIYAAGGVLLLPEGLRTVATADRLQAPNEWMSAQRFKMPKAEQGAAPVVAADEAE